jgi:hypothetical protein
MTATLQAPRILTPSSDRSPVERAVVDSLLGEFEPETFLWITFRTPEGGARVWYAWIEGGAPLGDQVDDLALTLGCTAADWLHIANRNMTVHQRGRVETQAHALRPMLGDLQSGVRATDEERDRLRRLLAHAAADCGITPRTLTPPWAGCGPRLLNAN